jgi:archaellum biogenesis ATPase FlaH
VADVVYGSLADGNCTTSVLTQKTSVQFFGNETSRQYAGSPGYIKGRPILFANSKEVTYKDDSGNDKSYT